MQKYLLSSSKNVIMKSVLIFPNLSIGFTWVKHLRFQSSTEKRNSVLAENILTYLEFVNL